MKCFSRLNTAQNIEFYVEWYTFKKLYGSDIMEVSTESHGYTVIDIDVSPEQLIIETCKSCELECEDRKAEKTDGLHD